MINYIQAVRLAGGVPIPGYAPQPDPSCRALLLCGGGDLAPQWFGQENRGSHPPDLRRDKAELNLVRTYLAWGRPILGICRGLQVLNVALGGTLLQIWGRSALPCTRVLRTYSTPSAPERQACWSSCSAPRPL